ncbi:MAG: DNA topoisomerase IB, partial [Sphingomonas sp.]
MTTSLSAPSDTAADLIFIRTDLPGTTRERVGDGWRYITATGEAVADPDEIRRLNAIALPPAYRDAWFAPIANAHILATGIDARGRKQYRYHPDYRSERETLKFGRCASFGKALPAIRAAVEHDLAGRGLTRERALASVVRLLDGGSIRIGNERYAKANRSFGATTLRTRHLKLTGREVELRFRAKSGIERRLPLTDRALIRFVRKVQALPGQHLFQYVEDGVPSPVTSDMVNGYLAEIAGERFTAKDFRTWGASVMAFEHLLRHPGLPLKAMLEAVA